MRRRRICILGATDPGVLAPGHRTTKSKEGRLGSDLTCMPQSCGAVRHGGCCNHPRVVVLQTVGNATQSNEWPFTGRSKPFRVATAVVVFSCLACTCFLLTLTWALCIILMKRGRSMCAIHSCVPLSCLFLCFGRFSYLREGVLRRSWKGSISRDLRISLPSLGGGEGDAQNQRAWLSFILA